MTNILCKGTQIFPFSPPFIFGRGFFFVIACVVKTRAAAKYWPYYNRKFFARLAVKG